MINSFIELLTSIRSHAGARFSGIGIIVSDHPEDLPLFPIRLREQRIGSDSLTSKLISVSALDSEYHDGFHVISSDFELTMVSQYFSPPIIDGIYVDREKRFGGRYLAALFGSALPGVIATGIATTGLGIAIFKDGSEIYFKGNL